MSPWWALYRSTNTISPKNGKKARAMKRPQVQAGMMNSKIAQAAVNAIPMMEKMRPASTQGVTGLFIRSSATILGLSRRLVYMLTDLLRG
jgi:hypothetical protein